MVFQEEAERRAYELGGGAFRAPAQRLADFAAGEPTTELRETTYKPGVAPADLSQCYPPFIIEALRRALDEVFDERMRGYLTNEALLLGVETRTSRRCGCCATRRPSSRARCPGCIRAGRAPATGAGS